MPEPQSAPAEKFVVRHNGKRVGPLTEDQVARMIERGQLNDQHEIATAGAANWQRIGKWKHRNDTPLDEHPVAQAEPEMSAEPISALEGRSSRPPGDWYVAIGDDQKGPLDEPTIGVWIREGRISHDTLVWRDGMSTWSPASDVFPGVLSSDAAGSSASGFIEQAPSRSSRRQSSGARSPAGADRSKWVLTLCVFTYLFAIESLAASFFLVYTAIVVRRTDAVATFSIASIIAMVTTVVIFLAAVNMTKLVAALDRLRREDSPENIHEVALCDRRVWVAGVWVATIVVLCQAAFLLMVLVGTARVT